MPFFTPLNFNSEDEMKQKQSQVSAPSNVISSPGAQPTTQAKNSSGSFANINQYLDANKDSTKTMADTIASNVSNEASTAQNNADSFKSSAPTQIKSYTQDDVNKNFYDQTDKADKNSYKDLKNSGGYSGPQTVDAVNGYNDFQTNWNKANTDLANTKDEKGRSQLLNDTFKKDNYSKGANLLDQSLIQRDDYAKNTLSDLNNKWSGITNLFNDTTTNAANTINSNIQNAAANKQVVNQAEQDYTKNFMSPIQQRAINQNAAAQTDIPNLTTDISDDNLSADTLAKLGLTDGQNLYNLKLNDYLSTNATQADANNVATTDERNRWAAIQNLIDGNDQSITTDGKAITPYSFDLAKFQADQAAQKAAYDQFYNNDSKGEYNQRLANQGFDMSTSEYANASAADIQRDMEARLAGPYGKYEATHRAGDEKAYLDAIEQKYKQNRKIGKA